MSSASGGGAVAALSPAQANEAVFWLVVFLVALLALSLVAVIASPARTASPTAEDTGGESGPSGKQPPASPLPPRVAGQSGAGYPAGDPANPPGVIRPPWASDGPPWGPAPRPPGVPSHVRYGGQVVDTSTGRTWRCPHNHPSPESATRCADFMEEQIKRLGWDKATGEHL
jgi:hypothetical protein